MLQSENLLLKLMSCDEWATPFYQTNHDTFKLNRVPIYGKWLLIMISNFTSQSIILRKIVEKHKILSKLEIRIPELYVDNEILNFQPHQFNKNIPLKRRFTSRTGWAKHICYICSIMNRLKYLILANRLQYSTFHMSIMEMHQFLSCTWNSSRFFLENWV